jgi:single-strand DNA-binding protein
MPVLEGETAMYQKTVVVGHLGNDPEMRYTASGVPVTSFNLATTRRWTNQNGEQQEKTTWFRVSVWRKQAETVAEYLKKGRLVLVEGEVEARAFTDRDGNPRASLELTANNVRFLGGRGDSSEPAAAGGAHVDDFPANEDEIPF